MKSKLLIFTIIVTVMLSLLALPAMAAPKVVDITRPEGNEVVTKDIFSIFGNCFYDETFIELEYYDKDAEKYKALETTDGLSTFKVGSSRTFGVDIQLKYKGENKIKILAYTKASKDDPEEFKYTITLGEEKKKGNWLDEALNWFGFNKDKK